MKLGLPSVSAPGFARWPACCDGTAGAVDGRCAPTAQRPGSGMTYENRHRPGGRRLGLPQPPLTPLTWALTSAQDSSSMLSHEPAETASVPKSRSDCCFFGRSLDRKSESPSIKPSHAREIGSAADETK